ncbi:15-hydroxyprostaglandin dehydrogenase [NAD(+)]-like [Stegodyphus dumicola]|uniref:15-hydroxyprostaglandin dehydrogenase [NAD(+)]-like n=1 Tax=Stegodyphus dumicola TaxID=202533 RepID=UPI0015AFB2DA|nr:15-hydroxyprostaglandin dehydrogenase [NAD(+)]-like [Stegodyphus dumicola]
MASGKSCTLRHHQLYRVTELVSQGLQDKSITGAIFLDVSKAFDRVGVINGIYLAFEYMGIDKGGSGGTVINTGSNAAFEPIPLAPVYSGCKHGVIGLTRNYGTDYHFKKTGVTVSSVCPGPVDTELFHEFPAMSVDEEVAEEHNKRVKPIKPEEVAKAMLQLLHDDKNGALLRVDADGMRYV